VKQAKRMTREQLEQDIVVIGSQSVLGQFPDAPAELLVWGIQR
jgi:hypothetical protein